MSKKIKSIQDPRLKLDILTLEGVQRIHEATLHIIANTGVRFPSKRALEIWEKNGAQVDHDSMVVKAPRKLIEEAIKLCPPQYTLAARDQEQDLPLDGNHVYLATDGCGVQIIDMHSGELRTTKLGDVADIARIADATEEIAFHWVPVSAQDKPAESRGLHELKAVWENSTKHVQTESIYNEAEAYAAVEMAKLIAGDAEAYTYLPSSTEKFLSAENLAEKFGQAGFGGVGFVRRMLGTVGIHWGKR